MGKQRNKNKSPDTRMPSTNLTDWEEHARELVRLGILPPTVLSNGNYDPGMNRPNQPDRSRYRPSTTDADARNQAPMSERTQDIAGTVIL